MGELELGLEDLGSELDGEELTGSAEWLELAEPEFPPQPTMSVANTSVNEASAMRRGNSKAGKVPIFIYLVTMIMNLRMNLETGES